MIERSRNDNLAIPLDTAILTLDSDLLDGADGEDTSLGRVDDSREAFDRRVHAHVRDGEGATLVLLGLELTVTGEGGERLDVLGDRSETLGVRVGDDGGHQADRGRDRDGNVGGAELLDDPFALAVGGVDLGDLEEGGGDGLDDEVVDRELVFTVGGGVEGVAELEQLADRQRGLDVVVGVGVLGLGEALSDRFAHAREGDIGAGGGGGSGSTGGTGGTGRLVVLDIGLGNASTLTGTLHILERDTLLESEGLGERRGADATGLQLQNGL